MKEISLRGEKAAGRVALIDDEDFELVSGFTWHVDERQSPARKRAYGPYARGTRCRDGRRIDIFMHTLLTGWPMTDHANGDGLDNCRVNLRPATPLLNNYNARGQSGTSSRFKGVCWNKTARKWQANIRIGGRLTHLGYFTSEEEAAAAYTAAALKVQGEYAYALRGVS